MASTEQGRDAIITGLAVAGVVAAINAVHMPTVAGTRASASHNQHIEAARQSNLLAGAAVVVGATLISKAGGAGSGFAATVFVIGGSVVVGLDVIHRLANATDHRSGKIEQPVMDSTAAPAA